MNEDERRAVREELKHMAKAWWSKTDMTIISVSEFPRM